MKSICVFCSSSDSIDSVYFDSAADVVAPFIENGYDLIYGGGNLGLMGAVSSAFYRGGRSVTGVIPEKLDAHVSTPDYINENIITETMADRKSIMRSRAGVFMALPGGFGTLEEILEVITLKQLGYIDTPVIIVNISGFYDKLLELFELIYIKKFAKEIYRDLYFVSDNAEEIFNYVENYKKFGNRLKW